MSGGVVITTALRLFVGEHVIEVAVHLHVGVAASERAQRLGLAVTQTAKFELRHLGEVPCEVRAPVAAADHAGPDRGWPGRERAYPTHIRVRPTVLHYSAPAFLVPPRRGRGDSPVGLGVMAERDPLEVVTRSSIRLINAWGGSGLA